MGMLIMIPGRYVNEDAVANVIHYLTRTRQNENRQNELFGYGGAGVGCYLAPDIMIRQFLYVQNNYNIRYRKGRRIYHEVLSVREDEFKKLNNDMRVVNQIAVECCMVYYLQGHQVVYAVHCDPKKSVHIHFAVNTINFKNGKKWHTNMRERNTRENQFNEIMRKYFPPLPWEEFVQGC